MSESNNTTLPRSDAERKDYIAELFARINLPSDLALHLTKGRGGEVYYAILYHFDPKSDQKRTIKEEIVGNSPAEVMEEMIAFLEKNQLIPLTPQATDKGWRQVKVSLKGYSADEAPTPSLSEGEEWEEEFDKRVPPRGLHPSAGDFNENGESEIKEFGYKRLVGDEIFTVTDWGNIKTFIRTLLSQTLSNERQRMMQLGEDLVTIFEGIELGDNDKTYINAIKDYQSNIRLSNPQPWKLNT